MVPGPTCFPATCRSNRAQGLTVVELLLVVVILGILAVLVSQGLQRTKDRAREVQCLAMLRGVGVALHVYAAESESHLPALSPENIELDGKFGVTGGVDIRFAIFPYDSALWNAVCPSDPRVKTDPDRRNPSYVSYMYLQTRGLDLGQVTAAVPVVRDGGYYHGRRGKWKSSVLFSDQHLEMEVW